MIDAPVFILVNVLLVCMSSINVTEYSIILVCLDISGKYLLRTYG